jgi:hypothetical protein
LLQWLKTAAQHTRSPRGNVRPAGPRAGFHRLFLPPNHLKNRHFTKSALGGQQKSEEFSRIFALANATARRQEPTAGGEVIAGLSSRSRL